MALTDSTSDGQLVADGTFLIPDTLLEQYPKRVVRMEEGGVLLVHTRLA